MPDLLTLGSALLAAVVVLVTAAVVLVRQRMQRLRERLLEDAREEQRRFGLPRRVRRSTARIRAVSSWGVERLVEIVVGAFLQPLGASRTLRSGKLRVDRTALRAWLANRELRGQPRRRTAPCAAGRSHRPLDGLADLSQQDDRQPVFRPSDAPQNLPAVQHGHLHIEQHKIRCRRRGGAPQGCLTIMDHLHREAGPFQHDPRPLFLVCHAGLSLNLSFSPAHRGQEVSCP